MTCPACNVFCGHAANCPTQLDTPEKRIRRAAHLFTCFYDGRAQREAQNDGISDAEISTGIKLAALQRKQTHSIYARYGDPAYGSYTVSSADRERYAAEQRALIDAHLVEVERERIAVEACLAEYAADRQRNFLGEAFKIAAGASPIPPQREHLTAVIQHARQLVSATMQIPEVA